MRDNQDWEGSFRRFAVIAGAFILAVAILSWGPWSTIHVPYNPGPSGTPGSTTLNRPHRQPPVPQRQPQGWRADRTFISGRTQELKIAAALSDAGAFQGGVEGLPAQGVRRGQGDL
jgi:hypothetical protein